MLARLLRRLELRFINHPRATVVRIFGGVLPSRYLELHRIEMGPRIRSQDLPAQSERSAPCNHRDRARGGLPRRRQSGGLAFTFPRGCTAFVYGRRVSRERATPRSTDADRGADAQARGRSNFRQPISSGRGRSRRLPRSREARRESREERGAIHARNFLPRRPIASREQYASTSNQLSILARRTTS
jgi:hypothetical protein